MKLNVLFIILFVVILGSYVLAHFVRIALFRGVDKAENKIREKKNRENGSTVEELASIYSNSTNESSPSDNHGDFQ